MTARPQTKTKSAKRTPRSTGRALRYALPPQPNEKETEAFFAWCETATSEEFFDSLVTAGIFTRSGKVRKPYDTDDYVYRPAPTTG